MLGGESFGIGIMSVKEIIEFGGITEVPMMPDSIRGVINLRGAVVPVMDLAARFGRRRRCRASAPASSSSNWSSTASAR
jgi:purine-binding chemotaxis protein CheW